MAEKEKKKKEEKSKIERSNERARQRVIENRRKANKRAAAYRREQEAIKKTGPSQQEIGDRERTIKRAMDSGISEKRARKLWAEKQRLPKEQKLAFEKDVFSKREDLGLIPEQQIEQPEGVEVVKEEAPKEQEQESIGSKILDAVTGKTLQEAAEEQGGELKTGSVPIFPASSLSGIFKVGKNLISNPKKVIQTGNSVKNSKTISSSVSKIRDYAIGTWAVTGAVDKIGDWLNKGIDEQQQALNTLGQMATTIGGQATEGTGDWRKGLQELQYIKQEVLRLEKDIKAGKISSAKIRYNGKVIDINADIYDQLSTIDEQISIIQSFALSGSVPELSELEMQQELRDLEQRGIIKPVDLTTSRRTIEEQSVLGKTR